MREFYREFEFVFPQGFFEASWNYIKSSISFIYDNLNELVIFQVILYTTLFIDGELFMINIVILLINLSLTSK